jgi:hypothetical protein
MFRSSDLKIKASGSSRKCVYSVRLHGITFQTTTINVANLLVMVLDEDAMIVKYRQNTNYKNGPKE